MIVLLGVACLVLFVMWRDEREMRKFWHEQWFRESRFALRLLGCKPKLKLTPRRAPGARTPSKPPDIVVCHHCRMKTRRVKNCDNCDRELSP